MDAAGMVNTPGIYYAIAYWFGCLLIIANSPKRLELKKCVSVQILFFALLGTIMVVSDGVVPLFIPLMILYAFMIFANIYVCCKYNARTAIYFAVRAFIIGEFAASFEWQVAYYVITTFRLPDSLAVHAVILAAVHTAVFAVLYRLERKNRKTNKNMEVNRREMVSALVIALAIFGASNLSFIFGDSPFSSQFMKEIYIIRTLVDLGGVAILYAYHIQIGELNTKIELDRLQDMLNMQYSNYEILQNSVDVVNRKYHDLKYQIELFKQEANAGTMISYLDQMEQEIKVYEAQNKTGNKVLDTILTGKSIYCQNNWIELTCVADGGAVSFMEDLDISTLFGNMLDNAIESVTKIEKKERRLIHLAVAKQKGFLRIREENCYEDELVFEDGLPASTKADKRYHGFGLKSIGNTVKKYGGSVTIHAENGWFELRILIPMPKEGGTERADSD